MLYLALVMKQRRKMLPHSGTHSRMVSQFHWHPDFAPISCLGNADATVCFSEGRSKGWFPSAQVTLSNFYFLRVELKDDKDGVTQKAKNKDDKGVCPSEPRY